MFTRLILVFLLLATLARAQLALEDSRIESTANPSVWKFTWQGQAGRTYFIQNSSDLQIWATLPVIEIGSGQRIEYGFTTNAPRFFFRLRFSDLPSASVFTADFDGDGVSNWDEIQQGLDPLTTDTDGDGMPDGYELLMGLNPLLNDSASDLDGDGVRNDEDARPTIAAIGKLDIYISLPATSESY